MCGIAGTLVEPDHSDRRLTEALSTLRHRGPDDIGVQRCAVGARDVLLGQTRLAVIDLTSGGHQPMVGPDGRHVLVFNGEICNYRELRSELERLGTSFRSQSDTEVLLEAWRRWGADCLPRLVGMFAFVVLDTVAGTLTCVRDAFGIKPMHYCLRDGFSFASEVPALVDLVPGTFSVDHRQAFRYLELGYYDEGGSTFVAGIERLRPAHLLVYDVHQDEVIEHTRWWSPRIEQRGDLSFDEAAELLRELVLDAVRLNLRSDVPLGTALSGGLDSSVLVGAMRHVDPDRAIHTFSYLADDPAVNEARWVDRMNDSVGAVAHPVVASPDAMVDDMAELVRVQGEPFASTSIYAQYCVFRAAREAGVTVTLDGQGADELFAGYAGYPVQRVRSLLSRGQVLEARGFVDAWASYPGRDRSALARGALGQVVPRPLRDVVRVRTHRPVWMDRPADVHQGSVAPRPPRGRHVAGILRDGITDRGLQGLLRHADRSSMSFSVESRVPFLTTGIAELALSLPEEYLVSPQGETKAVLRAAMRGIVPHHVLHRRDKVGFATPQQDWLLRLGDHLQEWVEPAASYPALDVGNVRQTLREWVASGGRTQPHDAVWRLLGFCLWLDVNGTRLGG